MGLVSLCELIICAGQGQGRRHVMNWDTSIFNNSTVKTKFPTFLFVSYWLILIIQSRPQSLLKFIFYRLMVLNVCYCIFGIDFAWVYQIEWKFFWVFIVYSTKINLEVFVRVELLIGHLDYQPWAIKPSCQLDCLLASIRKRYSYLSLFSDLLFHRPIIKVALVCHQLNCYFNNRVIC